MRKVVVAVAVLAAGCAGIVPLVAAQPASANAGPVRGDLDGDREPDFVVGAPGSDAVRVNYSKALKNGSHVQWLHAGPYSHTHQNFGKTIATGDFNGDGISDLAIGAPTFSSYRPGTKTPVQRGAIEIYYGSHAGLYYAGQHLLGPMPGVGVAPPHLGSAIAAADLNQDLPSDLIAVQQGLSTGNVVVYPGRFGNHFDTAEAKYYTATHADSLAAGDMSASGFIDLAIGSTYDGTGHGRVIVFPGTATWPSTTPYTITDSDVGLSTTRTGGTRFGAALVFDGYLAVGAPNAGAGAVVVLHGQVGGPLNPADRQTILESSLAYHPRAGNGFGKVLIVGRLTGNYLTDLIVGAPNEYVGGHANAGAFYTCTRQVWATDFACETRTTLDNPGIPGASQANAYFGSSLSLRDFPFDEYGPAEGNIYVGAPTQNMPGVDSGMVMHIDGNDLSRRSYHSKVTWIASTSKSLFGSSVL